MYLIDILNGLAKLGIGIGLAAIWAGLIGAVALLSGRIRRERVQRLGAICVVAFVFGLLALVAGIVTGSSRVAAVGQVLPAALSLIGGVALFLFSRAPGEMPILASAVASFAALLLLGIVLGSFERMRAEAYAEAQRYDMARLRAQADVEFFINGYRASRGLAPLTFERK